MAKSKKNKCFSTDLLLKVCNIIVKMFVKNGRINYSEFDDTKQAVIEKYLSKKSKIESAYNGTAKAETYLSAVIYRMVLETIRGNNSKLKRMINSFEDVDNYSTEKSIDPEQQLLIKNEIVFLQRVMLTLGNKRHQIELYLKYYLGIKLIITDLRIYVPNTVLSDVFNLLKENKLLKKQEKILNLCKIQNIIESKTVKPDAVRMYLNKNIEQIINRLNGNGRAFYTKDSFAVLFELLCDSEKEIKQALKVSNF
ncbi:MAG: hypothetical protein U9R42_04905 [Bacteroidota bacterium]|nr:hypothetical protein [Bacteroidota bacterium]